MGDWDRPLTPDEQAIVDRARATATLLYDGVQVPHRSCGIAMAETFGRDTRPYQALRRGGITGTGPCGMAMGGRLILGELLGDPDPTGPTTEQLKTAAQEYEDRLAERLRTQSCNQLTSSFAEFTGPARHAHCTRLASEVSALLAEVLLRNGVAADRFAPPSD